MSRRSMMNNLRIFGQREQDANYILLLYRHGCNDSRSSGIRPSSYYVEKSE